MPVDDDVPTLCAISLLAFMLSDVLHEAVGHGLTALLTGAQSGVLTTVAWSSQFDSRLVEAGGTLVNLAAALAFWIALRSAQNASPHARSFLLLGCAFNLFGGTGYFLFSGVTNFGDWAEVIRGMHPHWLWRTLLIALGASAYFAAVRIVGAGIVRYIGIPRNEHRPLRRFTYLPYFSAIVISSLGGLMNPIGMQLMWESALPATAGAYSGLLWLEYYIPRGTLPARPRQSVQRSSVWISLAVIAGVIFIAILGRGITLHRSGAITRSGESNPLARGSTVPESSFLLGFRISRI
jgi:hypothetical protein